VGTEILTMTLTLLDHININCADLARSRQFYAEVLGMSDGERPDFGFPGAWMYVGGRPVVHLNGGRMATAAGSGNFNHVAFEATDYPAMLTRIKNAGVDYTEADVPGRPQRQIFVHDPDGIRVELNFTR